MEHYQRNFSKKGRFLKASLLGFLLVTLLGTAHAAPTIVSNEAASSFSCTDTTIDKYRLASLAFASASSIITTPTGTVFAAGTGYDKSNISHWIVRKSMNGGTNWDTVDDYQLQPGAKTPKDITPALGVDVDGNIYAVGFSFDANNKSHWIVRRSSNEGNSWETIDNYKGNYGSTYRARTFTSDTNGSIYVGGVASLPNGYSWVIRRSTNNGATWTNVDEMLGEAQGATTDEMGNVYFVGNKSDGSWIVKKSPDGGATWSTVDTFKHNGGYSVAYSIASDGNGTLYASGFGTNPDNTKAATWIIRKSTDQGETWSTVNEYQSVTDDYSRAFGVVADANGNVYAAGQSKVGTNSFWVLRGSSDKGISWSTLDTFQYAPGKGAMAKSVALDTVGNVLVSGMGSSNWTTRKHSCN